MELTTERLHLRPFTAADHEAIHAVYADPEVMRYVGHGAHQTLAETAAALRIYGDVLERRGYSFLAVTERDGGALVGDGGLHPLGGRAGRRARLHARARRLGARLRDRAGPRAGRPTRSTCSASRACVAQVEPENAASRHVLEKLGMTRASTTRTAYGRPHLLYAVDARLDVKQPAAPRGSSPPR